MNAFTVRDGTFAMIARGEYELTPKAAAVYWFLLFHGIWEPGHQWFGYVDIKMTSNFVIQLGTRLSEQSVRRALQELAEKEFIKRKPRFSPDGRTRTSDSIAFTTPDDWCQKCQKRGQHVCGKNLEE
jgi:hypothetical protein